MPYPLFHPERRDPLKLFLDAGEFADEFPGESDHVEFKRGVSDKELQRAIVAFSNADGGVVLCGVDPNGRPRGISALGEKTKEIHQIFSHVQNPGRYDIHQVSVDGSVVLVISIQRRIEGFSQSSKGSVLIRRGASNVALIGPDLSNFLDRRRFARFESTATEVPVTSADPDLVDHLAAAHGWADRNTFSARLVERGFATRGALGDEDVLTVAGTLFLLDDPARIGGRPYIEIHRYTADEADPNRSWTMRGTVDTQIEQATSLLSDELGTVSAVVGTRRVDLPRLPERALREAIANAVAHRSYEATGTSTRIDLRPTQVTITSPGGLPEPVTIEHIRDQQAARNDLVLATLRRLHLAEDQGRGIDRIQDDMAGNLLSAPEFATDGATFTITLTTDGVVTPKERAWVRSLIEDDRLDPRSSLVLVDVARTGRTTNKQVRERLGIDSVQARSILQGLVSAHLLTQVGERGGAEYQIAPELGVPERIRHTDDELDRIALQIAGDGPVTNTLLRERTGLDAAGARKVLRRLVATGLLIQRGSRRGTRYELP